MKRSYWLVLAALALVCTASVAAAESKYEDNSPPAFQITSICDTLGYKLDGSATYSPAFVIPDNNVAGARTPDIATVVDGTYFTDVTVSLNLTHTWIGDVVVKLEYYQTCGDATPAAVANVICRPGGTVCGTGTGVGCSSNFVAANELRFNDAATSSLPSTACVSSTNVAAGCYRPTGTTAGGLSTAFQGLLKGGCFKLFVQDNASLDTGTLTSWAVYSKNEAPVPTVNRSWGTLKSIYR